MFASVAPELNITPSYFVGWDDGEFNIPNKYSECFFQNIREAWKGKGFPNLDYKYPLDEKILKSISFEKNIAIKMMDRIDLNRYSFNFSDRQSFFYYLLKRWFVILDHYKIDIIISPNVPHRVFDYVLYIAAKLKNIEVVMFQETSFANLTSIIIDDVNQTPQYLKNEIKIQKNSSSPSNSVLSMMKIVKGNYKTSEPYYMRDIKKISSLKHYYLTFENIWRRLLKRNYTNDSLFHSHKSSHIFENIMPYEKKGTRLKYLIERLKNFLYIKKLENSYNSLITKNLNQKYIFVALHYQPEETTTPTGGIFTNQELIINLLDSFLEKDIAIVVKEHKSQFYIYSESATGRSPNFYKNILNISSRVKFVDANSDPFELIDRAIATVTVSSTVGWESVIRGTPSLIFGRAWYEDMKGVYKIKSIEDLRNNWKMVINDKNNLSEKDIMSYHSNLEKFLIYGKHSQSKLKPYLNDNDQNLNIFNGIKNHLIKKGFLF